MVLAFMSLHKYPDDRSILHTCMVLEEMLFEYFQNGCLRISAVKMAVLGYLGYRNAIILQILDC